MTALPTLGISQRGKTYRPRDGRGHDVYRSGFRELLTGIFLRPDKPDARTPVARMKPDVWDTPPGMVQSARAIQAIQSQNRVSINK